MKALLSLGLAALALTSAQAQVFGPRAANGALIGGIAGAVIGHNSGSLSHNGWQGAAIGAGVGALIGAAADRDAARYDHRVPAPHGGYIYREAPRHYGYGGNYGYGRSAAHDGLWVGALAGGIIGHNHGGSWRHNGWRGAAWGAGAGWVLGSIIDANRYYYGDYGYRSYDYGYYGYGYPRAVVTPQPVVVQAAAPAPAATAAPQQVTIINNYYGNAAPMASANSLFGR
ncbi:MAG: glycine zipper 2TM domain-containing protein [Verrucomicrobia bacterium]|nr:glycine zipper 2TM domain-containing protein [Verrucomicrobiota bacterium]